jgi:hypothetical protein
MKARAALASSLTVASAPAETDNPVARLARRIASFFRSPRYARTIATVRPPVPAKGFVDKRQRQGVRRIVVTVDEAMFGAIAERARADDVAAAEAIRRLIQRGLR